MKTTGIMGMVKLDLISIRGMFKQMLLLYGVCGLIVAVAMGDAVAIGPMLAVLAAMMLSFNLCAYDELNGWTRYRAALPLGRGDIVRGRYVSILILCLVAMVVGVIFAAVLQFALAAIPGGIGTHFAQGLPLAVLLAASALGTCIVVLLEAFMLPFVFRYGFTKATRLVPVLVICTGMGLFATLADKFDLAALETSWIAVPSHAILVLVAVIVLVLLVYAASSIVACRIYRDKEL